MSQRKPLLSLLARWAAVQRGQRPGWATVLALACALMAAIAIPVDLLFTPVAADEQVWFGYTFAGWAAKVVTIPHLLVYAAGAYGFWRMAGWMWPWGAAYAVQVAFSMFVWGVANLEGLSAVIISAVTPVPFLLIAAVIGIERERFGAAPKALRERYDGWALVTGASAGIGEAFARALAAEGFPLVLSARRQDRLEELALELSGKHGVEVRVVALDLGEAGAAERLADAVADLEIGVLIANAGFGYVGRFDRQDAARLRAMVELNCVAPMVLTNRLVAGMRRRGRGAVVVTGSVAGRQPVPFNGVYAATKAFDSSFGEMLWAELLGTGIDVLVLEPGATETEFQMVAGETAHAGEQPEAVVANAFAALGRTPSVVSGWGNWLTTLLVRVLPRPIPSLVAGAVMAEWTPPDRR
jgi:short-subunit dehydrogenase